MALQETRRVLREEWLAEQAAIKQQVRGTRPYLAVSQSVSLCFCLPLSYCFCLGRLMFRFCADGGGGIQLVGRQRTQKGAQLLFCLFFRALVSFFPLSLMAHLYVTLKCFHAIIVPRVVDSTSDPCLFLHIYATVSVILSFQAMEVRKGTTIGKFLEYVKLQLSPEV